MLTWRLLILEIPSSNLSHNASYYKVFYFGFYQIFFANLGILPWA